MEISLFDWKRKGDIDMNFSQALLTGQGITLSEALSTGGLVTVTGFGIVFGVLIILMFVLMLFKVIFGRGASKKDTKKAETVLSAAVQPADETVDEGELIAVLTAAVAASLNTSTYNLKIKSYRRVDGKKPAWNRAGVSETINNRF